MQEVLTTRFLNNLPFIHILELISNYPVENFSMECIKYLPI